MPRSLSEVARAAANAPETGEVFLFLLEISHPDISPPIRVVQNNENITSRGNEYIAYPFDVNLPDDDPANLARVTLAIDNIDRVIVDSIRGVTTSPNVVLEVVLASSPDLVESGPMNFIFEEITYDSRRVSGRLVYEDVLNESFPADTFHPADFPGLF